MRLIHDHVLRTVGGNMVLVPLSERETDFKGMIVLNHSGEFICRKLKNEITQEELVEELAEQYHKAPQEVQEDVEKFLAELKQCHMLIR